MSFEVRGKRIRLRSVMIWTAVALLGAVAWGILALARGEDISAVWLLFAAVCSYAIAYRFYARFIAKKVLGTDDRRAPRLSASTTTTTISRPTGACCSGITSRPSPAPGRWSGRCWRPRWLPPGHGLDNRRSHLCRCGAGHGDPVLLHAP